MKGLLGRWYIRDRTARVNRGIQLEQGLKVSRPLTDGYLDGLDGQKRHQDIRLDRLDGQKRHQDIRLDGLDTLVSELTKRTVDW
jgi:hypothetical protein